MGTTSSRMSTKRRRTGQSTSRSGAAREPPQQLQQLPDDIEKENAAVLNKLPREMWEEIVGWIDGEAFFPFALTCRYFRDLRQDVEALKQGRPSRRCPCLAYKWSSYAELRSTLQSYTYIDTHDFDDAMYDATIDNGEYPLLPLVFLCLLSLTALCLAQTFPLTTSPSSLLTMSSGSLGKREVLIVERLL